MEKENGLENRNHHFNFGRLFWGLLIIVVGIIYFVQNSGLVPLNFSLEWWQLWPTLIIGLGLSLLSSRGIISTLTGMIITLLALGLVVFSFVFNQSAIPASSQNVSISRSDGASSGNIILKTGAGKLTIAGNSNDLISGSLNSTFMEYQTTSSVIDGVQNVEITGRGSGHVFGRQINNADLKLNNDVPVSMSIDSGAIDMNLDYSDVKLDNLDINTGASTLNLTLGDKEDSSHVIIDAGASSINIILPKAAGARVVITSGLSSKNFTDFNQVSNNTYESNNYNSVSKKIDITLSLGASSLNINWQ